MKNKDIKPLLAYLSVCFFWGSTYIAIRIGVHDLPPMLFASFRFLIAGSIVLVYAKIKRLSFPDNKQELKKIIITGLLLLMGGTGLLVTSEKWLPSGIASLIAATIPIVMTIIEVVILRRAKIRLLGIFGLLLGFGGVILLSIGGTGVEYINPKGIFVLVAAIIFWSTGSVYSKGINAKCSFVVNIGIQMISGGLGLLIAGTLLGEFAIFTPTLKSTLALLYLVVFGSLVGYSSFIYMLQKLPIAKASTYAYVNPIVAVFLGAIILHEPITIKVVISLVIILAGVILVQKSKIDSKKEEA